MLQIPSWFFKIHTAPHFAKSESLNFEMVYIKLSCAKVTF